MPGIAEEHPHALASAHTLAGLRRAQGLLEAAEDGFRECLRRRERVLGRGHPDTAASAQALAEVCEERGGGGEAAALRAEYLGGAAAAASAGAGEAGPGGGYSLYNDTVAPRWL
jgi:hypothetical protein